MPPGQVDRRSGAIVEVDPVRLGEILILQAAGVVRHDFLDDDSTRGDRSDRSGDGGDREIIHKHIVIETTRGSVESKVAADGWDEARCRQRGENRETIVGEVQSGGRVPVQRHGAESLVVGEVSAGEISGEEIARAVGVGENLDAAGIGGGVLIGVEVHD